MVNPVETLWATRAGERSVRDLALIMLEPKQTSPRLRRLVRGEEKRSNAFEYDVKNG